jgi:glutathione synthase/RimK-type ligase-like ATP-grasp enzyme
MNHHIITIGIACGSKKRRQFFEPFASYCESQTEFPTVRIECKFLDFDRYDLPQVDILFHKVTDDMHVQANDLSAQARLKRVKQYIETHSNTMLVIEDLEAVERVQDRIAMSHYLNQVLNTDVVKVPGYTILDSSISSIDKLKEMFNRDEVKFPVVCKTVSACGDATCHNMAMAFTYEQVWTVMKDPEQHIPLPILAQEYINHDSVLYKAYAIGDFVSVQARHSLRNVSQNEHHMIRFNSQHTLPIELLEPNTTDVQVAFKHVKPVIQDPILQKQFDEINHVLSNALNMYLYGFDLIRQTVTQQFYVVDVNYLPGFNGFENTYSKILSNILSRYNLRFNIIVNV